MYTFPGSMPKEYAAIYPPQSYGRTPAYNTTAVPTLGSGSRVAVQRVARLNIHSEFLKPMTLAEANSHHLDLPSSCMVTQTCAIMIVTHRRSMHAIDSRRSHILNHAEHTMKHAAQKDQSGYCTNVHTRSGAPHTAHSSHISHDV